VRSSLTQKLGGIGVSAVTRSTLKPLTEQMQASVAYQPAHTEGSSPDLG
jgi:hypothetical protein